MVMREERVRSARAVERDTPTEAHTLFFLSYFYILLVLLTVFHLNYPSLPAHLRHLHLASPPISPHLTPYHLISSHLQPSPAVSRALGRPAVGCP